MKVGIGRAFVMASALLFLATVLGIAAGYRVNVTPSLPLGLIRLVPVPVPLQPGDLVAFTLPLPLRVHADLGHYAKPIGGLPGDTVCLEAGTLFINGLDYGPVLPDAPRHALPDGTCETVPAGYVFTASTYPRSYDSRYFSVIPLADLQGVELVWTWEGALE